MSSSPEASFQLAPPEPHVDAGRNVERCTACWRQMFIRRGGNESNTNVVDACSDVHVDGSGGGNGSEGETSDYRVIVDGFQVTRRQTVFYNLSVSHGNARWPIRRRFREVVKLHRQILQALGTSTMARGLPQLPPKVTCRSLCFGPRSDRFLAARSIQLQQYLQALLIYIPCVDQCEVLRNFLCSMDVARMTYENLLELGDAVGRADDGPSVDQAAIEALPRWRSTAGGTAVCSTYTSGHCAICQENVQADEDVRVLPCGHEYHYACIAQWLPHKNTCCICQCTAIPIEVDAEQDDN